MLDPGWRSRADTELLLAMPARERIALEVVLLLGLVFGETTSMVSAALAAAVVLSALVLAMALVRPWSRVHGGALARVASTMLVVLAVVAPGLVQHPELGGSPRRLGVEIAAASAQPGDPPGTVGLVLVQVVAARTPADGVIRVGDRISAVGGVPLDDGDPVDDLTRRTHGDDLPEDTVVTVLRDGRAQDLAVHIPRPVQPHPALGQRIGAIRQIAARHIVVAAATRGALLIGLILLLLRADRQPISTLGMVRSGALRELAAGSWMTLGAFGVQIAVAIPIGIIGLLTGVAKNEASQRSEALGAIAGQGSIAEFVLAVVVAAAFEEVAFRGFLIPRVRVLTGSWMVAVLAVSVVFGLGHVYEGAFAMVQTAFLGAYFAALFLLRRRLLGPTVAHAAFNTVMLLVVRVLLTSGVLERLKTMAPH